jgi:hypothetical protein
MHSFFRFLILAALPVFVSGSNDSNQSPPDETGKKKNLAKEADAAVIAKRVKQLGNPNFTERDEATKALQTIGGPALDALRKAAKHKDTEVAQRATRLVETIENSIDQLLVDYQGYGLPLPPDHAKLVRFESGGRHILNDKLMPPTYFLGFLLRPATKGNPGLLLVGTQETRLDSFKGVEVVEPKPELVKSIDLRRWGQATFELNDGLAIALQCKARGWTALAQELWTSSLKRASGHHFGVFYQPANLPGRTALAHLAWAYSGNELVKPDTDRTRTFKRMKAVLAAEPGLNTEVSRALLKSLEAALVPSRAKPGTVERLIDDLTNVCNTGRNRREADPRYSRLADMGFAAVPALLEHLDDDRLTRSVKQGFNNFPTWHMRVRDVVGDLLQELAGEELGKDWLRRQQGWAVEKADAQAWWEKARKEGEEEFVLAHVLPAGAKAVWPNSLMLRIITKKHPQHLPRLYKTVLDERPKMQSWPIAEAVAKSSLPDDKKRELFLHASRHKNLEHRRLGLSHLQKLDPEEFMGILLATLEALPKTPTEPYWSCPEAAFAHLVMATDDGRAWKLLEKVAKRSDVGLRMAFMNPMNYSYIGAHRRQQRLDFLAAFLEDAGAPDVRAHPEMFEGPHAGFMFGRLEVRNLAAMKIASILGLPEQPDRTWTPEQWEKLRNRVKEGLRK